MLPQQPCLRSGTCYDVDPAGQGEAGVLLAIIESVSNE